MPYVIMAIAAVNALALLATFVLSSSQTVFSLYGFVPARPHALTVLSSMFLHVGILHFAGNMFFLWMFGYRVENTFGRWWFALLYLICGYGAAGLHYAFNAASAIPCVGASGAISGIMGCYFVLFPNSRFDLEVFFFRYHVKSIPTHTHGAIGVWVAEQALLGLLTQAVRFSSTAFWAHVGGFATGAGITGIMLLVAPQFRLRGEQPFMVRSVKGAVHDTKGNVLRDAVFQIRLHSGDTLTATTDAKGRFAIPHVPDGEYPYTASQPGWQDQHGIVIVRKKTRFSVPIRIRMSQQSDHNALTAKSQACASAANS